jgi:hypothetical protein
MPTNSRYTLPLALKRSSNLFLILQESWWVVQTSKSKGRTYLGANVSNE